MDLHNILKDLRATRAKLDIVVNTIERELAKNNLTPGQAPFALLGTREEILGMTFGKFAAKLRTRKDPHILNKTLFNRMLKKDVTWLFRSNGGPVRNLRLEDIPVKDLINVPESKILDIRGLGLGSLEVLREVLLEHGISPAFPTDA